jgi:hypothetical protein
MQKFSIIELELITDTTTCAACATAGCQSPGFCSPQSVDDRKIGNCCVDTGLIYNESDYLPDSALCFCPPNVLDAQCQDVDACANKACNAPNGLCDRGVCACYYGFTGDDCEIAPDPCDVGLCEYCMPRLCTTEWAAKTDCGAHGAVDTNDQRLCVCSDDYTGTWCENLPIYGCTYGDAVNFNDAGTVDDGTCVAQAAPSTLPTVGGLTVATVTLPAPIAGSLQEWSEHCSTPTIDPSTASCETVAWTSRQKAT